MKKTILHDMKYTDILYHRYTPWGVSTKCNFDYHNENYGFFGGKKIYMDSNTMSFFYKTLNNIHLNNK